MAHTYYDHVEGIKKMLLLLVSVFLAISVFAIINLFTKQNREISDALTVMITPMLGGGVAMLVAYMDFQRFDRVALKLETIDIGALKGDARLVDVFNGWKRRIRIQGKVGPAAYNIKPRFESGLFKSKVFFDVKEVGARKPMGSIRLEELESAVSLNEILEGLSSRYPQETH